MSAKVVKKLQSVLGDAILETSSFRGDEEVRVALKDWVRVAQVLRDDPELAMNHWTDLTAVDWPEREMEGQPRFDVLFSVRSFEKKHRIRVKTYVKDGEDVPTLTTVWAGANWAEREVFDMFGIRFRNHPDLRRILTWESYPAHPLRKDYPLRGRGEREQYRIVDRTSA